MNTKTQELLHTIQSQNIFDGIKNTSSIPVVIRRITGNPEEIYWTG